MQAMGKAAFRQAGLAELGGAWSPGWTSPPHSAFLSGRSVGGGFLGRWSRDSLLTPGNLQLFPEIVFKAEKESGKGYCFSQIVSRESCQVQNSQHMFVTITPSLSLVPSPPRGFPPSFSPFLFFSFSLTLRSWSVFLHSGDQGYG